jgi:PII interaction protein X
MSETYLNHPTFGLLSRICAQRLFFLIVTGPDSIQFEPVTRADARLQVENRMRALRRTGTIDEHNNLQTIYKRTFL